MTTIVPPLHPLVVVLFAPVAEVVQCHSMAATLCAWPTMPDRVRQCVAEAMRASVRNVAWVELWPDGETLAPTTPNRGKTFTSCEPLPDRCVCGNTSWMVWIDAEGNGAGGRCGRCGRTIEFEITGATDGK